MSLVNRKSGSKQTTFGDADNTRLESSVSPNIKLM